VLFCPLSSPPHPIYPHHHYSQEYEPNPNASLPRLYLSFIAETVPSRIYFCLLLQLPWLYFNRVMTVVYNSQLGRPDIKKMGDNRRHPKTNLADVVADMDELLDDDGKLSPCQKRFKKCRKDFVDSLIKEWETLNVVSGLLAT
jgi:hypothetical protein